MTTLVFGYFLIGLIFGCMFAVKGYAALQPDATAAPIRFRMLLIPACLLLWPYLLYRWLTSRQAQNTDTQA